MTIVRAPVATTAQLVPPMVAVPCRAEQSPLGRQFLSDVAGNGAHLEFGSFSMPSQSAGSPMPRYVLMTAANA